MSWNTWDTFYKSLDSLDWAWIVCVTLFAGLLSNSSEATIYFRDFSYELENCETLENDIRNVVNRLENISLNFFPFIFVKSSDFPGSRK